MKKVDQIIADYREYHTNTINRFIHLIGIPVVIFSLLILLSWVHISVPNIFSLDLAWILVIVTFIYYVFLDYKLALGVLVVIVPLTLLANWIAYPAPSKMGLIIFAFCFVGGWILQFIGHIFERKRPALFDNVTQVFSAPLFLAAEIAEHFGWRKKAE